jgi:hypothetical protein
MIGTFYKTMRFNYLICIYILTVYKDKTPLIVFQISVLTSLGFIEHFSPADRKIGDWFVLTLTTGFPWGSGVDSRLQVSLLSPKTMRFYLVGRKHSLYYK